MWIPTHFARVGGRNGWGMEVFVGEGVERGLRGDAEVGVRAAGLPESGSGFAVFLIHTEVSRRAAGREGFSAGRNVETRMLSQRECERPVTGCTGIGGQ
jgi:hypothetical protein